MFRGLFAEDRKGLEDRESGISIEFYGEFQIKTWVRRSSNFFSSVFKRVFSSFWFWGKIK